MNTFFIISLLLSSNALEQADQPSHEQDQITQRIDFAQELLEHELPPTRQWFNILRSVYGGAAAVNAVLAFVDEEGKVAHITHASKASLGLIRAFADPYVPTYAADQLAAMPQTTEEEKKAKLAQAEALLDTTYHAFRHPATGARALRTQPGAYTLPASVRSHIDVIGPVDRLPPPHGSLRVEAPPTNKVLPD